MLISYYTIKDKSEHKIDNYVYIGQLDLSNHLSNTDDTSLKKILFLGSSAISGSNIPPNTTITDHFNQLTPHYKSYNLAVLQSNLLDSIIMLSKFKKIHPKIAILGIDPSMLIPDQSSLFSKYYSSEADPELKIQMKKFLSISFADQLNFRFHEEPLIPTYLQVQWKSFLLKLRLQFWGNIFNKKIYGNERNSLKDISALTNKSWDLIDTFIRIARENNIEPVIFLEPIISSTYEKNEFKAFEQRIIDKSLTLKFTFLNYSSVLPNTHDYFYDYVHLSPLGHSIVAQKLITDLSMLKLIEGVR